MIQLPFEYSTVNSGKTIEILKVAHDHGKQNRPVVLMTSGIDTGDGLGAVSGRIGLKREVMPVFEETDVSDVVQNTKSKPYCVLIGEAQFLKKRHVIALMRVVDELSIPVMALSLKNDLRNKLFEESRYLLFYADKIEEIKTICRFCHKKAIMDLHYIDGKPVYEGDRMQIGGDEAYYSVCRKRCFHPLMITEGE